MPLEEINARAQESFDKLKQKMGLANIIAGLPHDVKESIKPEVAEGMPSKEIEDKINKHLENKNNPAITDAVIRNREEVNMVFNYITSLNLPPQLSLVVGLIISYNKSNKIEELMEARKNLKEFMLLKGYSG